MRVRVKMKTGTRRHKDKKATEKNRPSGRGRKHRSDTEARTVVKGNSTNMPHGDYVLAIFREESK